MDEDKKKNKILNILKQIEDEVKSLEQTKAAIQEAVQKRISEIKPRISPTTTPHRSTSVASPHREKRKDDFSSIGENDNAQNQKAKNIQKSRRAASVKRYRPKTSPVNN